MEDTITGIVGILFIVACILVFGGIGWLLYDQLVRMGLSTPAIMVGIGLYILVLVGSFIGLIPDTADII